MNRGGKKLVVAASFAAAGCAAAPSAVEVRPIANPAAKLRAGTDRLADAKGQLAIGNVGLALEGFRKAAREYPDNPEAFAGMAACYEAMRRFDLAESNYQAALALAPKNAALLAKLAAALDRQGKADAATEVRGEIAQIQSASAVLDQAQVGPEVAEASLAPAQTVSVVLPASVPVAKPAAAQAVQPVIPAPNLRATETINVLAESKTVFSQRALGEFATLIAPPAAPVPLKIPAPRLTEQSEVNVRAGALTQLRPVQLGPMAAFVASPAEPVPAMLAPSRASGPRLERLSLGEVALLTVGEPVWRGQVVARTPQKVTVRWVPVNFAATRPNIRLLNAARSQGLAARSRDYLLDRGWRKIEIGDADAIRERSIVFYPATRPATGRSLAAQFGFRAQPAPSGDVFVVFLGRDAAGARTAPKRG